MSAGRNYFLHFFLKLRKLFILHSQTVGPILGGKVNCSFSFQEEIFFLEEKLFDDENFFPFPILESN